MMGDMMGGFGVRYWSSDVLMLTSPSDDTPHVSVSITEEIILSIYVRTPPRPQKIVSLGPRVIRVMSRHPHPPKLMGLEQRLSLR